VEDLCRHSHGGTGIGSRHSREIDKARTQRASCGYSRDSVQLAAAHRTQAGQTNAQER